MLGRIRKSLENREEGFTLIELLVVIIIIGILAAIAIPVFLNQRQKGYDAQAKSDVRAAFEEVQRADVALTQAQESAAFATAALDLASVAYHGGATTNLEVIDAERQSRDADTQAAIAEDAARQARLDLLAASGRFP